MASAEPFEAYLNAERNAKKQAKKEKQVERQENIKRRFGSLVDEVRDFSPQLKSIRQQVKEGKFTPEQAARTKEYYLNIRKEDREDQKNSISKAKKIIQMGKEDGLSRKFMISNSPYRPYVGPW
jgi:hypothetical protein